MAKLILELLKTNRYAFGLMSAEMQEKAREIGAKSEHFGCLATDKDEECWTGGIRGRFVFGLTYRLRPDYEEEPEIVECEIYTDCHSNLVYDGNGATETYIHTACRRVNFIGFNADGWIFGCLYRNKKDPSMVHCIIKEHELPLYDVISMVGGKVLFRRPK